MGGYLWFPGFDSTVSGVLESYRLPDGAPIEALGPIAQVNLLVGPNNSGKSRLLRALYGSAFWPLALDRDQLAAALSVADRVQRKPQSFELGLGPHEAKLLVKLRDALVDAVRGKAPDEVTRKVAQHAAKASADGPALWALLAAIVDRAPSKRVYIPALRTAGAFSYGAPAPERSNPLRDVVQRRYQLPLSGDCEIHTGLELYERLLELMTGEHGQREQVRTFEDFLSRTFFARRPVALRPRRKRGEPESSLSLELSIGPEERALHELGDGIGGLIILLAPYFLEPENTRVFIEEPELYLHPGFQRLFIETLRSPEIAQRGMVSFLATHSNHLVGAALEAPEDVSVFRFAKAEGQTFRVTKTDGADLRNLDELGVHNASVLLAGCSIWVEGPSDRDYVRAGLLAYANRQDEKGPRLLEDIHYAFFEYAGSNLVHYVADPNDKDDGDPEILLGKLTNRVFLLADRDGEEKNERFESWKRAAEEAPVALAVARTKGVEIENDLSPTVLRRAIPKALPKLGVGIDKHTFSEEDYRHRRMGEYLNELLPPKRGGFAAESGTLKSSHKAKLATVVLGLVQKGELGWTDLSDAHRKLIEGIVEFARKANYLPTWANV